MNLKVVQAVLGGKLIGDPYPFLRADGDLWVNLLEKATRKSISLYACLVKLRAIGAQLNKHETMGYFIAPIIRDKKNKWGFPSNEEWQEEKKVLLPYIDEVKQILKELQDETEKAASSSTGKS